MGYFPNGTSGMAYEEQYCDKCAHSKCEGGCAVWLAHLLKNYDECNNEDSILHMLIPRDEETGFNKKCLMFLERSGQGDLPLGSTS